MKHFITKMLQYGAELSKTSKPIEINMIINDAEILYKKHVNELKNNITKTNTCDPREHNIDIAYNGYCTKCLQ